ncbi:MAG TPA: phosphohydrolase [Planctomycetaceae bacterium]|nr:phosphohydrolase [Planctomycetaceae bacterium]
MSDIQIELERPRIEALFAPYRDQIGQDFAGYRNHVYRTVTYALYILDQPSRYEALVETAMVYHDIGLWTHGELAYLEPSESIAKSDNEKYGWGLDPCALESIIHWHHKICRFKGLHEEVVEACRRADWIDASQGWIRKGVSKSNIRAVQAAFPNHGFHKSLLRLAKELGGSTVVGGYKVTRGILKW